MGDNVLAYGDAFWQEKIGDDMKNHPLQQKQHAIFSLLVYLQVSLLQFLSFTFTSPIHAVRMRAGRFVSYMPTARDNENKFAPATLLRLWYKSFPKQSNHLDDMIKPYAEEMVKKESDQLIEEKSFQLKLQTLTLRSIRELLSPQKILEKYQSLAPFTWSLLYSFAAAPNRYRMYNLTKSDEHQNDAENDDWDDDPNMADDEPESRWDRSDMPKGFSRNPALVGTSPCIFHFQY